MAKINPFSSSSSAFGSSANMSSSSTLQLDAAWNAFEKMIEERLEAIKPKSAAQIKAIGDSRNKTIIFSAMTIILAICILSIAIMYALDSAKGSEFTSKIMPVITAIIGGTFGYLSGEKSSK
ncbi:hypothetical protein [Klebsiella pneumoniae]|uniref:hypothetical protein n=1 Tax=Klebsiella pneumoniae TaxID=573 RepID=UPI00115700FB|nr:hypothetical protein [Klebsiella pneumoniae]EIX9662878.1 hypothetical protein [Klebsiella pneumoniae]MBS2950322.1 hypothetical protein [Klebsiella pneumoniae]MCM6735182.1 hypothetical protein [Klebsiella pneumoniae]WBL94037.1 hypothetical protein M0536_16015 [Klebsiella pneumoniae subsp. pneumoniae]HBQ5211012.1 hypothetical protein [Klebsiella pneumoniae]